MDNSSNDTDKPSQNTMTRVFCITVVVLAVLLFALPLCCKWVKIAAADFAAAVPEPTAQDVSGVLPSGEKFKINGLRMEDGMISVIPAKEGSEVRIEIRSADVRESLYRRLVCCGLMGLLLLYLVIVVSLLRLIHKCVCMISWKDNWDAVTRELVDWDATDKKKVLRQWQEAKRRVCMGGD